MVFEDTSKFLSKTFGTDKSGVLVSLLSGGFAGFCSVMANAPVDCVKT